MATVVNGTLLTSQAETVDGSTPVLLAAYTPDGYSWSVSATLYVNAMGATSNDITASATILINAAHCNLDRLVRTDIVPIRTGSSIQMQNCTINITNSSNVISIYVVGLLDTTIEWSATLIGSSESFV